MHGVTMECIFFLGGGRIFTGTENFKKKVIKMSCFIKDRVNKSIPFKCSPQVEPQVDLRRGLHDRLCHRMGEG